MEREIKKIIILDFYRMIDKLLNLYLLERQIDELFRVEPSTVKIRKFVRIFCFIHFSDYRFRRHGEMIFTTDY